ncbi:MAG: 50S ribosomal protein L25 [Chloroflexi bacterium]|nr:50S ribosomal protein L25 [Chloroflexota bacterium]
MEQIALKAEQRTARGKKVRALRRQGVVPAVVYGRATQPIAIQAEERHLVRVLASAGMNQLINLTLDNGDNHLLLVREVQRSPITHRPLHVDFQVVVMTEKITTDIPLAFKGTSPIIKSGDGQLYIGLNAIEVECLPGNLVPEISVDISGLTEIDASIHVRDLVLPPGMIALTDEDEIVARVLPAVEAGGEEEEEEEAAASAEPEVITEAKAQERRAAKGEEGA